MNSTNWPAPNVWIFIAQMVEHCSANAEAIGSNPVEVPKTLFGFIGNSLNCNNHCDDHIFIQNLYFRSSHHLHDLKATASIAHFTNNVRLSQLCDLFKQQTTRSMGYRRYNPRGRDVGRTREKRVKSFACVHPTSQVGYLAGQLIENVVYCFLKNNLTFSMSLQGQ